MTPNKKPTVQQVVESAYAWADGDLENGKLLDQEDLLDLDDAFQHNIGDGLLEFLLRETSTDSGWFGDDAVKENSRAHWEQARGRMNTVLAEIKSIHDALFRFGPQSQD